MPQFESDQVRPTPHRRILVIPRLFGVNSWVFHHDFSFFFFLMEYCSEKIIRNVNDKQRLSISYPSCRWFAGILWGLPQFALEYHVQGTRIYIYIWCTYSTWWLPMIFHIIAMTHPIRRIVHNSATVQKVKSTIIGWLTRRWPPLRYRLLFKSH